MLYHMPLCGAHPGVSGPQRQILLIILRVDLFHRCRIVRVQLGHGLSSVVLIICGIMGVIANVC